MKLNQVDWKRGIATALCVMAALITVTPLSNGITGWVKYATTPACAAGSTQDAECVSLMPAVVTARYTTPRGTIHGPNPIGRDIATFTVRREDGQQFGLESGDSVNFTVFQTGMQVMLATWRGQPMSIEVNGLKATNRLWDYLTLATHLAGLAVVMFLAIYLAVAEWGTIKRPAVPVGLKIACFVIVAFADFVSAVHSLAISHMYQLFS